MANKPKDLASALDAAAKAGTLKLSIRVPWTWEPIERATHRFERLWDWLEECGAAEWDRVDSVARHFHPDYCADQSTRQVDPSRAPGHVVYLQMERGEYSPLWIEAVAPTLAEMMPKLHRGKRQMPTAYLFATLHVAAHLAAHEYANLREAVNQDPPDRQRVARHLYFFERFFSLWQLTGLAKPPSVDLNNAKRKRAEEWRDDLLAFHRARQRGKVGRRVSARESAREWVGSSADRPSFEVAYKALLVKLKEAPGR